MIEVLTSNTPNGKKITIMLEEIGYEYKITKININKDEQFKPEFQRISPFRKIPVIIDHEKNISLFESGAILIYLELDNRLKNSKYLAYDEYTIADIATFPWIARHEWHDIGLKKYKNLSRWYSEISSRDKVIKGYDLLDKGEEIPKV